MQSEGIPNVNSTAHGCRRVSGTHRQVGRNDFQQILEANSSALSRQLPETKPPFPLIPEDFLLENVKDIPPSRTQVAGAYEKQADHAGRTSDWEKYKDDQLLGNPGGDHYYLDKGKPTVNPGDQKSFWGRIGKDVSDAFSNVKNVFHNLFFGATFHYRGKNNEIREAKHKGVMGSVVDFFKDMGSALTFGSWRPDGEKKPQGGVKRLGFFLSKVKKAVFGDLVQGVTGSVLLMGEGLILGGWNLLEVLPDATIGNVKVGRELTTTVFDDGQVVIDYLTDILPGGKAWVRVHSPEMGNMEEMKAPILNNIEKPVHSRDDDRWKYVRNTPFRKTVETIGSLVGDFLTIKFLGKTKYFSERDHHKRN